MRILVIGFLTISIFISCSNLKQVSKNDSVPRLNFINSIEIPYNQDFKNTKIGGLSGIDYDKKNDLYYIISYTITRKSFEILYCKYQHQQ